VLTFYKFAKFVFRHLLPGPVRYPAARLVARAVCRWNGRRRSVIVGNLTPVVGCEQAEKMAPELLGNFLMTAVDFFCPRRNLAVEMNVENGGIVDKAYRRTKRVMAVTAHLGNWEIGISYLVEKGFPVTGVYAPYREDAVVQWILSHRNSEAEWIAATRGAAEACVQAVERGRVLGMVVDVPFGERGHRVNLCGHPAHLPLGPWAIAARAQATVIPAFVLRDRPGHYRLIFHDPIVPGSGTLRRRLEAMQEIYRGHLERYLKQYPEQWGVLQPFWDIDGARR
jgi:phosphatidylinositol dimannoside acyltransferase